MRTSIPLTGALAATAICLAACSPGTESRHLQGTVTSAGDGYRIALQMQQTLAPGTYLTSVLVMWGREDTDIELSKITYGFTGPGGGPGVGISLDNTKHLAYVETNAPSAAPGFVGGEVLPLDLSGKEVGEILEIARRNGLGDFCMLVKPGNENILFKLESINNGPVWHITADGWDPNGLVAQLRMDVDANSGSVINRSLTRPPSHK